MTLGSKPVGKSITFGLTPSCLSASARAKFELSSRPA